MNKIMSHDTSHSDPYVVPSTFASEFDTRKALY